MYICFFFLHKCKKCCIFVRDLLNCRKFLKNLIDKLLRLCYYNLVIKKHARVAEQADAQDLKSCAR